MERIFDTLSQRSVSGFSPRQLMQQSFSHRTLPPTKVRIESDIIKTHFKACQNYLVSPKDKMLADAYTKKTNLPERGIARILEDPLF